MALPLAALGIACGGDGQGGTDGAAIFAGGTEPACASCHTLSAAGATGQVGPDLDRSAAPAEFIEMVVRSGSGVMPSFADQLSDAEIAAVARYVADHAGEG